MRRFFSDVRYALRQARRSPGFAAIAIGVLGLGIGAATAIYSVVDNILLRPLDLPGSERIVTICETHPPEERYCSVSPPNLYDWKDAVAEFDALGVARGRPMALRTETGARFISSGIATPGFFHALGARPTRGRLLVDGDVPGVPGGGVVVAHEFWQGQLGGREDVIGSTILLDDAPRTVVGVLPEGFRAPRLEWIQLWAPLHLDPRDEEIRDWRGFVGMGRLREGVGVEQAGAALTRAQTALAEVHPEVVGGWGVTMSTVRDHIVAPVRGILTLFLAAVGVLLVIVCVNIANLLLARASARERELAVRQALGAARGGLTRLLAVEAFTLAAAGGLLGIIVAFAGTRLFVALAPAGIPRIEEVGIDGRIVAFALLVTAGSALLFGAAPVTRAWSGDLPSRLRDGRSGGTTRGAARLRRSLVAVQLGLALALVFGAGLLTRSFAALLDWRPGFAVERVLTFSTMNSFGTYPTSGDVRTYLDRAEAELEAIPGVEAVGTVSAGPLFGGGDGFTPFLIDGRAPVPIADAPSVAWFDAGPGYFSALGLPVIAGREFDDRDRPGAAAVAVVNRTMAETHWPDGSPVGARLRLPEINGDVEIVGVVEDIPPFSPAERPGPELYFANRQRTRWGNFVVVRTAGDPGTIAAAVRTALARIDPDVQPGGLTAMEDHVAAQLVRPRFNLVLVSSLGLAALLLGAAGIFGVVAYSVAVRRHEIGLRLAIGADRRSIVRWVLADGLRLLGVGLLVGVAGAYAFARLLQGLIVGVNATDPVAIAATALVLGSVVVLASLPPALRAASVDPAEALRAE